jgi:SPP1 gp7 family putative phage head morphogenesis protein
MVTLEQQQQQIEQQTEQQQSDLEQTLAIIFGLLLLGLTGVAAQSLVGLTSVGANALWSSMIPLINVEFRKIKRQVPDSFTIIIRSIHSDMIRALAAKGIEISDVLTQKDVQQLIQKRISGLTLNDRIERNRKRFIAQLRDVISASLRKKESYEEMTKRIRSLTESQGARIRLIVRTEIHRIRNQIMFSLGKLASKSGINLKKTWIAMMDNRTRQAHKRLNGTTKPINSDFTSTAGGHGPAPGLMGNAADDINCRCRLRLNIS